jgi:hypothetical protein
VIGRCWHMAKNVQKYPSVDACLHELRNVRGAISVVFDCKGCAAESDLSSERCWRGVSASLGAYSDVDSIVLSGYTETEYSGPCLEALNKLRRAARAAQRLSSRAPPSGNKTCQSCRARPSSLFAPCAAALLSGPRSAQMAFIVASDTIARVDRSLACKPCLESSTADLTFLWKELDGLCAELVRETFGIVGEVR